MAQISMLLCRSWWTSCRKSSSSLSRCLLLPSRSSKRPRPLLRTPSRSKRRSACCRWRSSWWVCQCPPQTRAPCRRGEEEFVALARDDAGRTWFRVRGPRGLYWWLSGARHVQWAPPEGLGGAPVPQIQEQIEDQEVDVSVNMLNKFQQSLPIHRELPQFQFINRVSDISVMLQRQVHFLRETVQKLWRFRSCSSLGCHPVLGQGCCCARLCNDRDHGPYTRTCGLSCNKVVDVPVVVQRHFPRSSCPL